MRKFIFSMLLALCLLLSCMSAALAEPYSFVEPAVKEYVCNVLHKQAEHIYLDDLEQITKIIVVFEGSVQLDDLANMPVLEDVSIRCDDDSMPSVDLSPLESLSALKVLGISGVGKIENFEVIASFSELNNLFIYSEGLTDTQASHIGELSKLEYLYVDSAPIKDVSWLSNLSQLKEVSMGYTNITNVDGLKGLENLEYVLFENNASQPDLSFLLNRGIMTSSPYGEYISLEEWYEENNTPVYKNQGGMAYH